MIPQEHVQTIEQARVLFQRAVGLLREPESLRALLPGSKTLREAIAEVERVASHRRLLRRCDGRVVCAIIGASGHGKTTFLNDLFPDLADRGWLVTEKTDTTSQSLRIEHASTPEELASVDVHSWDLNQIIRLVNSADAVEQNGRDGIRVENLKDVVIVDGSKANFAKTDREAFRFAPRQELRPLSRAYSVPAESLGDSQFIRALTIKELPGKLSNRAVITEGSQTFNALQLRAVVKDVTLHDTFDRVARLSGVSLEQVKDLIFVDTPGLATASSLKDEVLRHCLEQKSNRIVLELWKDDDLDIIVHLVLCGEQSNFATLWKAVEAEVGPDAIDDLGKRLVLVINGMNIYFKNPDLNKKFNPKVAALEGDHLATTVVDNVLQKMSPRGRITPSKVCFVDSPRHVGDASTYASQYQGYRKEMLKWVEPGGVGRSTLEEMGVLESFRENVDGLCDPKDCGHGFLLRKIREIAEDQGPALLSRKYLKSTGLHRSLKDLRAALRRYYGEDGTLSHEAVAEALQGCLRFLDPSDPRSVEAFAQETIDPGLATFFSGTDRQPRGLGWVAEAFQEMARIVRDRLLARSSSIGEVARAFSSYYDSLVETWSERWGYSSARMAPPSKQSADSGELIKHSLKFHAREILYQLMNEVISGKGGTFTQDETDRRLVRELLQTLAKAERLVDQSRIREDGR